MIKQSNEVGELQTALAKLHCELEAVKKDSTNPHFKSTFASLAANIEAADKLAGGHGLCVVQLMSITGSPGGPIDTLTTRICHSSGQWMESEQLLHLPKDDPQGQGSAMTYGRRYNYQGALGLVAEDDDAEAASTTSPSSSWYRERDGSPNDPNKPTEKQMAMIRRLMDELGMSADDARRDASKAAGREVLHLSDLTKTEASSLIDLWKTA